MLYTILQLEVGGSNCNLFNKNIPTQKVQFGFTIIRSWIEFTPNSNIGGDGIGKYFGTSEKAENLVVAGASVAPSNFLRSDVASTSSPKN